jgi:hypothetical protein
MCALKVERKAERCGRRAGRQYSAAGYGCGRRMRMPMGAIEDNPAQSAGAAK